MAMAVKVPEVYQKRLLDNLAQEKLKAVGPIWGQMFDAVKKDGVLLRLDEVMVPVESEEYTRFKNPSHGDGFSLDGCC